MSRFESVWGFLDFDQETDDIRKRSDYLILIWARLNGQSGSQADKARKFGLPVEQIHNLMNIRINKFNLSQLTTIARKIGITVRL